MPGDQRLWWRTVFPAHPGGGTQDGLALGVSADVLVFDEDERGGDDGLRQQIEATVRLDADERQVIKTLIDAIVLKHDGVKRWAPSWRSGSQTASASAAMRTNASPFPRCHRAHRRGLQRLSFTTYLIAERRMSLLQTDLNSHLMRENVDHGFPRSLRSRIVARFVFIIVGGLTNRDPTLVRKCLAVEPLNSASLLPL